ncbi:hypothetical protein ABAC460_17705 [Asticcacaulis sp. AC460]|nr:hypothetical protein ABAC460_17705 [Asticcacaulis sp. AC460]
MLKAVLYIFALLGLLISPVSAQAAQNACLEMSQPMQMTMADSQAHSDMAMPCCEDEKPTKSSDQGCFQNCIAMCGISATSDTHVPVSLPILHIELVVFTRSPVNFDADEPALFVPPPRFHT